jgi:hypothetical protein
MIWLPLCKLKKGEYVLIKNTLLTSVFLVLAITGMYATEKEFKGCLFDTACGSASKNPAENILNLNP